MNKMANVLLAVSALSGFLFVALGAFAAHGLTDRVSQQAIQVFNTGVLYHALHTFAIMGCSLLLSFKNNPKCQKWLLSAAICFMIGILFFSGSLYGLVLTGEKWFGPITPLGGMMFLIGWGLLFFSSTKMNEVKQ